MATETKNLTVGELIKKLKKYPKTSLIVMATDEEGNGMNTCCHIEPMNIVVGKNVCALDKANQLDDYDLNNPGGNAVYFLAFQHVYGTVEEAQGCYPNSFAAK